MDSQSTGEETDWGLGTLEAVVAVGGGGLGEGRVLELRRDLGDEVEAALAGDLVGDLVMREPLLGLMADAGFM